MPRVLTAAVRRSTILILRCTKYFTPESTKNKRFEFRAEFFNMFNHTQFDNPDGNSPMGPISAALLRARKTREQIQFALKFYLLAVSSRNYLIPGRLVPSGHSNGRHAA